VHRFETWRDALQGARSRTGVDRVMRGYAHALPTAVRAILPGDCQAALSEPIDVQAAAVALVQAELALTGPSPQHEMLHEVAHTFAAAAVRFRGLPESTQPNPSVD
jgi:hypothetical protein